MSMRQARRRDATQGGYGRGYSALILSLLAFSILPARAVAQTGSTSGSTLFTFGSRLSNDESNYTLFYSVPRVIHAGVETNMTFYVYLTLLSGWKIQSQEQVLQIIINTPTRQVAVQKESSNVTLYQGGRWGPFNMTFDLNDSQAALSPGQVVDSTVFADLLVYEAYDNPISPFVHDSSATLELTASQIVASGSSSSSAGRIFASLAVGLAVVGVLAVASLETRKKSTNASV